MALVSQNNIPKSGQIKKPKGSNDKILPKALFFK